MRLPQPELWIMDWVLCAQGETATPQKRDELMAWRALRERVWQAQLLAAHDDTDKAPGEASIELTLAECEELLALVPTTFRWGTGEDVGFSLKRRLATELWGDEMTDKHATDKALRAMFAEKEEEA